MSRHYSLDSLVVRGQRLFGWGFYLEHGQRTRVRALRVPIEGDATVDIAVFPSGHRADLVAAFPESPRAGASGFMVHGRLPANAIRGAAALVLEPSGEVLPLPGFPEAYTPGTEVPLHRGWSRVKHLIRQRGWVAAVGAAAHGIGRRTRQFLQPDTARVKAAGRGGTVVLDHGMGGGAGRYCDERVAELGAAGAVIVRVRTELSSLSYPVQVTAAGRNPPATLRLETQGALLDFIAALQPRAIEINHFVGFEDTVGLIDALVEMKARNPALRLRFNLHDFHALCPSFALIDAAGRHCGVPALETCRSCLPVNARFSLGMNGGIDVLAWRSAWQRLFDVLDEHVAFSRSSLDLLSRGFPSVAASGWRVEPHRLDARGLNPIAPCLDLPMKVVAVGHLNHAKGATLLVDLARRAGERGLPLRFAVIGTLDATDGHSGVRVTGAFARENLCALLEAERTGIALLPSICPETYSYVTDELMATGLPLAVLDLGAPAERALRYPVACLLPCDGLDAQLDALVEFADSLRRSR